jgi:hypothetical protein
MKGIEMTDMQANPSFSVVSHFISTLQPELGLTNAQVDDLFQQASQIS